MQTIRTKYDETKVQDERETKELSCTQDLLSIKSIDESGIFGLREKRYSKLYTLSDINFAGVTEDEQKEIIINFSKVLKTIPCRFSYAVANEYVDEKQFNEKILYRYRDDEFDALRKSYNRIIKGKVSDAKQGLYQTIYLTLTIKAENMSDAKAVFLSMESAIRSAFMGMGVSGMQGVVLKAVPINKRMQLLFKMTHLGISNDFHFDFKEEITNNRDFVNAIAPANIRVYNEYFEINSYFGKVMYVSECPKSLESDIISSLSKINCTSYVTVNNELLDLAGFKQEIARKYMSVGMKIENEKQRNRNNNDYLADASAKLLNEKEKLDEFSKEIDTSDDHYFNTTILVLFFAKTKEKLDQIEDKLKNAASIKSVALKPCFGKQIEGINSCANIGVQEFKHVTNLSSTCLAMFMPFKTQELNDKNGVYYGINQLSQNAIFADKKLLKNHNGLILGQSGSGKSVFAKSEIISTFLNYINDQIIIIDPQSEYGPLCKVTRGTVISFDSTKEYYLNPLDVDYTGIDYGMLDEIISQKSDFILTLLSSCLKRDILPEETTIIDEVVRRVYRDNYSMRQRLNGHGNMETKYAVPEYLKSESREFFAGEELSRDEQIRNYSPTLQDIYQGLLDYSNDLAEHLADSMGVFVNGSLNLFNHRTNVDLDNRFLVFDISGLKDNLRVTAMLVMMETVRSKIKSNATSSRWTHLYIDEFHELLGVKQVAAFILRLWKEIRKLSGVLNGITQNMTDLLDNDSGNKLSAILSNTEYFALLSQSSLDKEKLMKFLPQISPALFNYVENAESGTGIIKMGCVCVPFDMRMNKESEIYQIVNTDGGVYGV